MFKVDSKRIRTILFESGLTVKDFAARCGLNFITARKLTSEDAKAQASVLSRIAKTFNVDAETLLLKEAK